MDSYVSFVVYVAFLAFLAALTVVVVVAAIARRWRVAGGALFLAGLTLVLWTTVAQQYPPFNSPIGSVLLIAGEAIGVLVIGAGVIGALRASRRSITRDRHPGDRE